MELTLAKRHTDHAVGDIHLQHDGQTMVQTVVEFSDLEDHFESKHCGRKQQ
jgi:hypothetical protein